MSPRCQFIVSHQTERDDENFEVMKSYCSETKITPQGRSMTFNFLSSPFRYCFRGAISRYFS
jgi:hypothetical protein